MHQFTKYELLNGDVCQKKFWLDRNEPVHTTSPSDLYLIKIGQEIGRGAQSIFKKGRLVCPLDRPFHEAVAATEQIIDADDVPALFEPAFEFNEVRVRVDVLERANDGAWLLYEAKSVSELKEEHLKDIAIQVWVLRNLGLKVRSANAIILNRDYVRDLSGIDWPSFLKIINVTDDIEAIIPDISPLVSYCISTITNSEMPNISPGKHCPSDCIYWEKCTLEMPEDWVFHLPNLSRDKFYELTNRNILSIADIPKDFPLSKLQSRVRAAWKRGKDYLSPNLCDELAPASHPAFYLDFEATSPPIPLFEGHRPFQRLPFQWSLHFVGNDRNTTHQEFLAEVGQDPRREFAESLIKALGSSDYPIIVYSAYEGSILRELADAFPDLQDQLIQIIERLFDLLPVVRTHTYFRSYKGSFSIKKVEPALTGEALRIASNPIQNGQDAAFSYLKLFDADYEQHDLAPSDIRDALLLYCRQDTEALINVHMQLLDKAGC